MTPTASRIVAARVLLLGFGLTTVLSAPAFAQSASRQRLITGCGGSTYASARRAKELADARKAGSRATPAPVARANAQTAQGEAERPSIDAANGVVTKTTINSEALQSSNSQNSYDAIKDVPGVQQTDTRGGAITDSLQIRGIKLSSTTSYRLDGGLPIANNIAMPIEDKCRVEALKGAGALEFGIASPAGIVNYVMKRASDIPNTSIALVGNGYGQSIGSADVGGRFGSYDQFGVRVSLAGGEYGSFTRGAGGTRYLAAMTGDWQPSDRASLQLDFEQFGIDVIEQAPLQLLKAVNGKITVPNVPDPTVLLSGPWANNIGVAQNVFARGKYDLGGGFQLVAEAGRSEGNRPTRNVAQISAYNLVTGKGTMTITQVTNQETVNGYQDVHLKNHAEFGGDVANDFTVGWTHNVRDFNNPQNPQVQLVQNIYHPILYPTIPAHPASVIDLPNNDWDTDYYASDNLTLGHLRLLGGVRQVSYTSDSVAAKTFKHLRTVQSVLAPAGGFVFDMTRSLSVYGSYLQSLEESGQAPVNTANAYSVLPPARATQREIGLRTSGNGLTTTLGYFSINKGNATTDPVTNIFALNGTIDYQGLESTASVRLDRNLTFNTGAQLMRARQDSIDDPTINGKMPENTPNFSGSAGFAYRSVVSGLGFNVGANYFKLRQINPQDQGVLPGYMVVNTGASYVARMGGRRYTLNLNMNNALNKRYFSTSSSNAFGVGAPRLISLTTRVDL
ncbi:MAG: TonB-dependent receptor [Candidatus Eremiobacteraeota bacterium]|nr:TonB-dependent receptor [Candidatus Eremiobacteraeota bacterium]